MTWTNVPKPTGANYTKVTFQGKEFYDDASIIYDSPTTYYDSANLTAWTDVAKPTGTTTFSVGPGNATGLLTPPTYPYRRSMTRDQWTRVNKPT